MHNLTELENSPQEIQEEDLVNNPSHYDSFIKDGPDCITAMQAAFGKDAVADFALCNSFKYIWRHHNKNGKQDIHKAIWYLNKYLELQENPS